MYKKYVKRVLDIILSAITLILISPIFLVVAIMVRVKLGSHVIFKQKRPGKNEKIFTLYKFRTMTDEKDSDGNLLPDKDRLTDFGQLLRSTSLDELPELVNILKGDMSIVGPRPLLIEYLPYYTTDEKHRHDVCPGLTGLAQVRGRNACSWDDKFKYDLQYVNNLNFKQDMNIVYQTIKVVLKKDGVEEPGSGKEINLMTYRGEDNRYV